MTAVLALLILWAVTAAAHLTTRGQRGAGDRIDWDADDGIEIAQGLALAAFGIFATIAIFAVLETLGIGLVEALFGQLMP